MLPSFRTVKFYAKTTKIGNKNKVTSERYHQELPLENTLAKTFAKCAPLLTSQLTHHKTPRDGHRFTHALSLSCFLPFDRGAVSCAHDLLARRAVPSAFKHKHDSLINAMNLTFFFPSLRTSSAEWVPRGHSNKKKKPFPWWGITSSRAIRPRLRVRVMLQHKHKHVRARSSAGHVSWGVLALSPAIAAWVSGPL